MPIVRFQTAARSFVLGLGLALLPLTAPFSAVNAAETAPLPEVVVANATTGRIFAVVVTPSEEETWGENLVQTDGIETRDVMRLTLHAAEISPSGSYDILVLVETPEGDVLEHRQMDTTLATISGLLVDHNGIGLRDYQGDIGVTGHAMPSAYRGKGPLI